MKLEGKTAIVTGGGRGIGQGICHCLAKESADIAIIDIDGDSAHKVAAEIKALGRESLAEEADVTDSEKVEQVVQEIVNHFGEIDILVNNVGAGSPPKALIIDQHESEWDSAYKINLKSQFIMCRAVARHMIKQGNGKIINISSTAAKVGAQQLMPYSAAKAGVINFTKALARELAKYNINVNCICPGFIYTPDWEESGRQLTEIIPRYSEMTPREVFLRWVDALVPMRREQTPEDIGHLVVFLASEDARNITGQAINVDGGQVMY